jgi:cyclopropane fatty-acyl-phospholipid synthase-like methyltransferase
LLSPLKPGKMLDLGAGPGTFSLTAAQLGWEVMAVDARTMRTPDPEVEKDPRRAELIRSVRWVQADVREFPIRSGEYDLICVLGLMHHLELDDQIKLLRRCSNTLTLMSVRVAPKIIATEGPYEGLYRHERGETREERDQIPQASWGNEVSFIHAEESLLRLMRDCGYSKVMAMRPPHKLNYTFYLCLPSLDET